MNAIRNSLANALIKLGNWLKPAGGGGPGEEQGK